MKLEDIAMMFIRVFMGVAYKIKNHIQIKSILRVYEPVFTLLPDDELPVQLKIYREIKLPSIQTYNHNYIFSKKSWKAINLCNIWDVMINVS